MNRIDLNKSDYNFNSYESHMEKCNLLFSSGRSYVLRGNHFKVGHCAHTYQPTVFIPALLMGTIDIYHFILLSVTLPLARGHMFSVKQNLLGSLLCTFFN